MRWPRTECLSRRLRRAALVSLITATTAGVASADGASPVQANFFSGKMFPADSQQMISKPRIVTGETLESTPKETTLKPGKSSRIQTNPMAKAALGMLSEGRIVQEPSVGLLLEKPSAAKTSQPSEPSKSKLVILKPEPSPEAPPKQAETGQAQADSDFGMLLEKPSTKRGIARGTDQKTSIVFRNPVPPMPAAIPTEPASKPEPTPKATVKLIKELATVTQETGKEKNDEGIQAVGYSCSISDDIVKMPQEVTGTQAKVEQIVNEKKVVVPDDELPSTPPPAELVQRKKVTLWQMPKLPAPIDEMQQVVAPEIPIEQATSPAETARVDAIKPEPKIIPLKPKYVTSLNNRALDLDDDPGMIGNDSTNLLAPAVAASELPKPEITDRKAKLTEVPIMASPIAGPINSLAGQTGRPQKNVAAIEAEVPDSSTLITKASLDLGISETKSLYQADRILRVSVEDPAICDAVTIEKDNILVVGRQEGKTRVAVWTESTPNLEPRIYQIRVDGPAGGAPVGDIATTLTKTISSTFDSEIAVTKSGNGLTVRGTAKSETEARSILKLVRAACLLPVRDEIVVR